MKNMAHMLGLQIVMIPNGDDQNCDVIPNSDDVVIPKCDDQNCDVIPSDVMSSHVMCCW